MRNRSLLVRLLCAIAVSMLLPASVMAQTEPSPPKNVYLPAINAIVSQPPVEQPPVEQPPTEQPITRPTPYDVDARNIAINLGDVSDGFYVDSAEVFESTEYLDSIGYVNGYSTSLINEDIIFEEPFGVGSIVLVFMSTAQAETHFKSTTENFAAVPELSRLSVSTYGNETMAFVERSEIDGYEFEYFYVIARQGNVNVVMLVGGLSSVTKLSDATKYTKLVLEKITNGRSAGTLLDIQQQLVNSHVEGVQQMFDRLQKTGDVVKFAHNQP